MSNHPTERSRSGRTPDRRVSGRRRASRLALALIGLLALAGAAGAAEVVEVRVGRHPDFTRVVFELDRAAGYRIERSDPSSKSAELIISLEAGSIPRRIQSSKSFIEQVVVEPSGTRSVARIRLAKGGLKLKEMILASPPRIVLDVLSENEGGAVVAAKSPATTAKPAVVSKATPAPAKAPVNAPVKAPAVKPTPTAKPAPAPTLAASNSPSASTTPSASAPSTAQAAAPSKPVAPVIANTAASAAPAPATKVLATTEGADPKKSRKVEGGSEAPTASPSAEATPDSDSASNPEASPSVTPAATPEEVDLARRQTGSPAAETSTTDRPMVVKTPGGDAWDKGDPAEEGGGLMQLALAGAAALLVAFLALVVVRRRRAAGDERDDASDQPFAAEFGAAEGGGENEEEAEEEDESEERANPFAGLSGGSPSVLPGTFGAESTATRPTPAPVTASVRAADRTADKQEKKPAESLFFDDAEEKTMEGMEVISRSQANETLGGAMPMMGGASDELMQMFREMQRRVTALETRIDELVDARDRLERQVAAQTEELRVQRAAIARTQRAVRNLARPEDAGDDEPTEPALREPN